MHILVVRNDKLGDFMLAWPCFALIKHHWPEATITALVPYYTAEIARMCPWVDRVLIDEGESARALSLKLAATSPDAMLTLFSTGRIAIAGYLAKIPYRLAPATKLFQFLYNHRLLQRRSRSEKPEYAYNLDLAYQLLADFDIAAQNSTVSDKEGDYLPQAIKRPLLQPVSQGPRHLYAEAHQLDSESIWVVIHPGSGGSANNLNTKQYAQLATGLHAPAALNFIISAGPGEEAHAAELAAAIKEGKGNAIVQASDSMRTLVETLQWADLFISGSTGPLHIAAALDRPTAAFYPRHRSATPLRWQTLNAPHKRLAFTPSTESAAEDVSAIDVVAAAASISAFLNRLAAGDE